MENELSRIGKLIAIYSLADPRTDTVRYIGQSVDPKIRLYQHQSKPHQDEIAKWVDELNMLGLRPKMQILAWVSPKMADTAEALCMSMFDFSCLFNRRRLPCLLQENGIEQSSIHTMKARELKDQLQKAGVNIAGLLDGNIDLPASTIRTYASKGLDLSTKQLRVVDSVLGNLIDTVAEIRNGIDHDRP